MTIYEHTATVSTASGETSSLGLRMPGGLLRYFLVRSNTSTTVFRANLTDENSQIRMNYDFHQGELLDNTIVLPVTGEYTVNITNASPDDTFKIIFSVQEN